MASPGSFKIILGVTGGIAAYKACELVRLFVKAGHEVRVVMSRSAESFVGALSFQSLSNNPVLRSLHEGSYDMGATSHIDLARWGDIFVVAPATANFLAKARAGIADDALLTEFLAFQGPLLLAPAMNTRMWTAGITKENADALRARGVRFVGPGTGVLACGETGEGKMSEPSEIFAAALEALESAFKSRPLYGKKVLVTSGPTRNYLDSIRYISNRSSGRMGHAVAETASRLGAEVVLVSGPVEERFARLERGRTLRVETGAEMLQKCLAELASSDIVVAAAAVADFAPERIAEGKIRREGVLNLPLHASTDVLAELGRRKEARQVFVGFAAEAGEGDAEIAKAKDKLLKKNLDFLAFNNVSRGDIGFDVPDNEVILYSRDRDPVRLAKDAKEKIAEKILLEALDALGRK